MRVFSSESTMIRKLKDEGAKMRGQLSEFRYATFSSPSHTVACGVAPGCWPWLLTQVRSLSIIYKVSEIIKP